MSTLLNPRHSIVPIMRGSSEGLTQLLGTGFFVGSKRTRHLVTAKHVFDGNPLREGEIYAFVFPGEKIGIWILPKALGATDLDIAACPVGEHDEFVSLRFSESWQPGMNEDVFAFEYSTTRIQRKLIGGLHVALEPLTHKGNVMRFYKSDFPERRVTAALQVSFPALQGASGAPVLTVNSEGEFVVAGVLVANLEQELLPAQIVRIEEPGKYVEETKYFLPHGKAIDSKEVLAYLKDLRIDDLAT
ncbi:MAG TPA: serine protease [Gammaproteobacteria bacterium]|nr:serine protease [Gammaproteobacteria bacterium]